MGLWDITSTDAVLMAIAEYDRLGRDAFLHKYGFREARSYSLLLGGREYDSKAIAGVAHGYQYPELGPLRFTEFNGGRQGAGKLLTRLGFEVTGMEHVQPKTPRVASRPEVAESTGRLPDVVLVGCVKLKLAHEAPAEDLYISPLFRKRRQFAESTGSPWFILSALHGLVAPDQVLTPYDMRLSDQSSEYRRNWGARVLHQLDEAQVPLAGATIELHAGQAYVEPLAQRLADRGAEIVWPFRGLTQGQHLAWYGEARSDPTTLAVPSPDEAVAILGDASAALAASSFPWPEGELRVPGLYAWYVDIAGAHDLSAGLGHRVAAGLVYAGQAGAQMVGSDRDNTATLRTRLASHLDGNVDGSTWRRTLAAVLSLSEVELTAWMREHLAVVTVPVVDRPRLRTLEHEVLERLDPPLNLDRMTRTSLRLELAARRKALARERNSSGL